MSTNSPRQSKAGNRAAAQARAAQMRAEAAKKDKKRKQLLATAVAVVVVLIGVAVAYAISSQQKAQEAASDAFISKATSVPAAAFSKAGVTTEASAVPQQVPGGTPLMSGDKPRVLYVGGEFCPYCATERWALTAALSRFGTVGGLAPTRSAQNDGNIPTVSFKDMTYTSDYLVFDAWETRDRNGQPLETLPADVEALFAKDNSGGSIPWTSYGTRQTVGSGVPLANFEGLEGADAWDTIASQMQTGEGPMGKPIDAAANMITAQICTMTDNQPAAVCTAPEVVASAARLNQ